MLLCSAQRSSGDLFRLLLTPGCEGGVSCRGVVHWVRAGSLRNRWLSVQQDRTQTVFACESVWSSPVRVSVRT